ncbi:MAG: DoxX family protein [Candidatus Andersenbacteria bacterium]|nr:DoxX family protein [Candidatus Andersenbacteria bacterium]
MSWLVPVASAHEVYVLQPGRIASDVAVSSPNPFTAITGHAGEFMEWFGIVVVVLALLAFLSANTPLQKLFAKPILYIKKFAPLVARLTLGGSLIFSGYFQDIFGPELTLSAEYHHLAIPMSWLFIVLGVCIVIGFFTRVAAIISLLLFAGAVLTYHTYMLTYVNYLGEMLIILILGGGMWSLDHHWSKLQFLQKFFKPMHIVFEKYGFFILRVLFGISLIYASMYAKFLHSDLALDTVNDYHLTQFFHFTPLFLVLGAFLVESMIGIAFILGIFVRFFAVFFLVFLTMSIIYFGESVWPHLILFGVNIAIFLHGYDQYTLGAKLFKKKKNLEPVV